MRIGYCSPFNPMCSGISDFSEELVIALKKYAEIIIISPVKPSNETIIKLFEWHMVEELEDDAFRNTLDCIVYHMGNNIIYHGQIAEMLQKYPGIVEFHEIGLHNIAIDSTYAKQQPEEYIKMAEYCHGKRGREIAESFLNGNADAPWDQRALDMPMNRYVIEAASAVIVHSETAKQMVLGERSDMPIVNILLHASDISYEIPNKKACRKDRNLPENACIFGSFGFATSAKRIIPALDALEKYVKEGNQNCIFLIVGQSGEDLRLKEEVQRRDLGKNVVVTGFVSLDEFKQYMGACDFCLNLRYPTRGESSASLHRMLGMGKPTVVTDIGTFSDYPDDVVIKVRYDEHEVEDIYQAIQRLSKNRKELEQRSNAAVRFAKENCDIEKNAQKYVTFFEQVTQHTWHPDYEDVLIGQLCDLGLTNEAYLKHIWAANFGGNGE